MGEFIEYWELLIFMVNEKAADFGGFLFIRDFCSELRVFGIVFVR